MGQFGWLVGPTAGNCSDTGITDASIAIATAATPLPAGLLLFDGGLGALGLFGSRKKRKAQANAEMVVLSQTELAREKRRPENCALK